MVVLHIDDLVLDVERVDTDFGVPLVLIEVEVCGEDTCDHVVKPCGGDGAVLDSLREVVTPVAAVRHHQIQAGIRGCYAGVLCGPVACHEALESELSLEDAIQQLAVLAAVAVVHAVVGAPMHPLAPNCFPGDDEEKMSTSRSPHQHVAHP